MKEAMLYKRLKDSMVQCRLCSHFCTIKKDMLGKCNVRKNISGKLYSLVYRKIISAAVDPIEKKPLYHFLEGTRTYSIATVGCNLSCLFCQNSDISQVKEQKIYGKDLAPETIVKSALSSGCNSISYTYTEPTIFMEFALDVMKLAKKQGLKNIWVTNGFMSKECLDEILPYLDAANIDLKSFSDDFYKDICGARLAPVLENIRSMHKKGVHIEITTLLIDGKNDSEEELKDIADFIASIDKQIPWHISRSFPMHKMQDIKPTPREKMMKAKDIGKKAGLKNIHLGNII